MFIIGIDPHKRSHTAAVIDGDETVVAQLSLRADRRQRDALLRFAAPFSPRLWAVEGASGVGELLAQQLVHAGETVVDVPPALSARARLLDATCYRLTIISNLGVRTQQTSGGGGVATASTSPLEYSDNTTVYVKVEKTCASVGTSEAVSFSFNGHL